MRLGNTNIHQQGEIPEITKLPNGRIRVIRRFVKFTREDVDNVNLGSLLGDFGDLDTTGEQVTNQGYTNCRLIEVEVETSTKRSAGSDSSNSVLVQTYETLTDSFVEITDPTISYGENGLKKITRVFRAVSGTTSSNVVGTTKFPVVPVAGTTTTYLASSLIEDNTAFAELTEIYLEAGQISISEESGPQGIPNTKVRRYTSQVTEPTSLGIVLSRSTENTSGYKIYNYSFLEGATAGSSPVTEGGEVISYVKNIEVRLAGVVSRDVTSVTGGTISSLNVVPPSVKDVQATISIKLVTTNTISLPVAYNLSGTSCAATLLTTRKTPIGIEQGNSLTVSVFNRSYSANARSFPNSYHTGGGTSSVTTPAQILRDDDSIIGESLDETTTTSVSMSGSTTAPATTGVYQDEVDPAFLDADGTQYYRRTTYTI